MSLGVYAHDHTAEFRACLYQTAHSPNVAIGCRSMWSRVAPPSALVQSCATGSGRFRLSSLPMRAHLSTLSLAAVAIVLLVEGFVMRPAREPVARDIDSAVRRVQTLSLGRSAFTDQRLIYRAEYLDPRRWFFPFQKPFVFRTPGGYQSIFPTLAAAIDVPFEYLGGFPAIRAVSIAATGCAAWLLLSVTGHRRDWLLPVLFVLATPVWFYSMGASGPPVAMALALGGVFVSMTSGPRTRALFGGLLIGVASLLRDESLALLPGLMIVLLVLRKELRSPALALAGAVAPVVAMAVIDRVVYDRPAAAHMLHAVSLFADVPAGSVPALSRMGWYERYATVLIYWLDGHSTAHLLVVAAVVLAGAIAWWRYRSPYALLPAMAVLAYSAVADTWMVLNAPRRLPGLLRLSPFVAFAALPAAFLQSNERSLRRAAQCIAAVFILVALLTTNTAGGKSLGPRLLLPAFPLIVLAAWLGIRSHLANWREGASQSIVGGTGALLIACALIINVAVEMPIFRTVDADATAAARHIATAPDPAIVFGNPLFIEVAIPAYTTKAVMLVSSAQDRLDIASRLAAAQVRTFLSIGRDDGFDLVGGFEPFTAREERRFGPWIVRRWGR